MFDGLAADEKAEIGARVRRVRQLVEEATVRSGRLPSSVRLLAVSKGKSAEAIRAAYQAGQRDFGENYAQEFEKKAEALADLPDLCWHFIGRLQRNKAKQVTRIAKVVHTVDRAELASELGKRAAAEGLVLQVLVEVNVGDEESKGGCAPGEVGTVLSAIAKEPRLVAAGLMTIPPDTEDPEGARPYFAALRALRDEHGGTSALPELSMGMSHDFPIAIEEGATMVRVGTAIFGARAKPAG